MTSHGVSKPLQFSEAASQTKHVPETDTKASETIITITDKKRQTLKKQTNP